MPEFSNPPNSNLPAPLPPSGTLRRPSPAVARPGAAVQPRGLTPLFVLRVFANWWKWVVPTGIALAVVTGAAIWFLHVPKYESTALIQIESQAPYIAFEKGQFTRDSEPYIQTQIELLRGPVVLNPVMSRNEIAKIADLKLAADPLEEIQKHLRVSQVGKSELYKVSYMAPSADEAASVANAVVEEYMKLQSDHDSNRLHIVLEVLEKERVQRGKNVERLRREVVELAREVTGKDPFGQGMIIDPVALAPIASLHENLIEADVDYEILKAELQGLKNSPIVTEDKEIASGLLDLEISNRSDVRRLEDQLGAVREQLMELKSGARLRIDDNLQEDPKYRQLAEQEQGVAQELEKLKSTLLQELAAARREQRKAEQVNELAAKKAALAVAEKKRDMLNDKLQKQMGTVKSGGAQSAELEFKKAELEREQNVFELIAARKLALQTEQHAPARVSFMQKAMPPRVSIEPIPYKYLLLGCLVGLLAPLGLAVGYEALSRRISSSDDLSQEASLPVLGELARFPRRHVAAQESMALPGSLSREAYVFAESVDSLRTQLMLTEQVGVVGNQRVVAVCSAASGEGKSSLATSLALSLAEATKRPTLLIDADLRSPDIANFLKVPSRPGICEVVEGKAEREKAIHRVGNSSAYVLPAGRLKGSPHHVFEGSKIENLLAALRDDFDTILIDTPPVLAASDALVYAKAADLVLFCSLADTSRASQVRVAVERLRGTGANVAGAVLSGVSVGSYVYRYGTYGRHD